MDDHINRLYDADFLLWIDEQVALLRTKQFDQLDLENLIEEVGDIGGQYKYELSGRADDLLLHLLKYRYQLDPNPNISRGMILEQRQLILRTLEHVPSLKNLFDEYIDNAYEDAVQRAAVEAERPRSAFPSISPFNKERLLDLDYLPALPRRRPSLRRRKRSTH